MFKNAKVGDRVWSFVDGWGTITKSNIKDDYPIDVDFDNGNSYSFYADGRYYYKDINPRIFWNEIKFETPEKSFDLEEELRKLKIVKFEYGRINGRLLWNDEECITDCSIDRILQDPSSLYFDGYSIEKFMESIKDKKITKKQFFEAYNNVFFNNKKEEAFNLKEFLKENLHPKSFEHGRNNYYLHFDHEYKEWEYCNSEDSEKLYIYFSNNENSITDVVDMLNDKHISVDETREAFKELGWL